MAPPRPRPGPPLERPIRYTPPIVVPGDGPRPTIGWVRSTDPRGGDR
jgi:hypothetical protein